MTKAKILDFPYSRVRQEPEAHTAKILSLPRPGYPAADIWSLPMAVTLAWLSAFNPGGQQ
jgi:hypothetical protein